jgi:hypothetical protein
MITPRFRTLNRAHHYDVFWIGRVYSPQSAAPWFILYESALPFGLTSVRDLVPEAILRIDD